MEHPFAIFLGGIVGISLAVTARVLCAVVRQDMLGRIGPLRTGLVLLMVTAPGILAFNELRQYVHTHATAEQSATQHPSSNKEK